MVPRSVADVFNMHALKRWYGDSCCSLSGLSFALLSISALLVLLSTIRFLIIRREIASPASSDRRFAVFETSFVLVLSTLLIAIAVFGFLAILS